MSVVARLLPIVTVLLLLLGATAHADRAAELRRAEQQLADGAHEDAAAAATALLEDPQLQRAERAQAHRIRGLALFHAGRRDEAEAAMRAYLTLEPDAHLDPALVPPEAVVFFESVRTRYAGELRIARPRPKRRRLVALNFLPPLGQFQNGDRTKGWILAGAGTVLLATNLTTYVMLASSCESDLTCTRDPSSARALRVVNLASGLALLGLWGYGVIDGLVGYQRAGRAEAPRPWALAPIVGWGRETVGLEAVFSF